MPDYDRNESVDSVRRLSIMKEASEAYALDHFTPDSGASADAKAICTTVLIAADILRRTIIAAYDDIDSRLSSVESSVDDVESAVKHSS